MSASTRTVQVTLGMRHLAAALVAAAVAISLAVIVAIGPFTAAAPKAPPVAVPAPSLAIDPPNAPTVDDTKGLNGTNGRLFRQ